MAAPSLFSTTALWADTALDADQVWEEPRRVARPTRCRSRSGRWIFTPGVASFEACRLVSKHDTSYLRCGSLVHARTSNSLRRTWALIAAAAILYIPANVYPVLTVIQAGAGMPRAIMDGISELVALRIYPLAILVFFASVLVTQLKPMGFVIMPMIMCW